MYACQAPALTTIYDQGIILQSTTMVTNKLKEIEATRAKLNKLQEEVAEERSKELKALPAKYGFNDVASFIKAVKAANGGKSAKAASTSKSTGRRKRAVITAETKNKVKALTAAGKTGSAIAKAVGISVPSVQNIKKELGLTKARKK